MTKQLSLKEAVQSVKDHSLLALGGNALQRSPIAFVKELIHQQKKNLSVIKTAGALDVDLLAGANLLHKVYAGYIGFEMFGLAPAFRKAVEKGEVIVKEHACASVIAALRASIYGVPFQPIHGFQGSDIPKLTGLIKKVTCPFTKEQTNVVQALKPDVTVVHVNVADEEGNGYIAGAVYEDLLMVKAAKRVFITAEQMIPSDQWEVQPQISGFYVDGVVHVEKGAAPGSCVEEYSMNELEVKKYIQDPKRYINELKGRKTNV